MDVTKKSGSWTTHIMLSRTCNLIIKEHSYICQLHANKGQDWVGEGEETRAPHHTT